MRFYNRKNILYVDYIQDGKRIRKSTKLAYNEFNINQVKRSILNQDNNCVPFLNDLVKAIIEEKRLTLKETSILSYESVANSLIYPYFKDKLITTLKAKDFKQWQLNLISKGITSKSITFARTLLNQSINNAILEDIIISNPLRAVKVLNCKSNYEIDPFSINEIELILNHADKQLKNLLATAFFSGMRIGEVIGLKWSDIDFLNNTISINRTINKGYIQTPKTKTSIRTIEILEVLRPYLLNQQRFTKLKSEFVFLSNKNRYYSSSYNLRYSFTNILNKANVRYRPIYQTRHSFASLMLSNDENLLWVSQMLGHKNSDITLKKYSKYVPKENVKRAKFLDNWHNVGT